MAVFRPYLAVFRPIWAVFGRIRALFGLFVGTHLYLPPLLYPPSHVSTAVVSRRACLKSTGYSNIGLISINKTGSNHGFRVPGHEAMRTLEPGLRPWSQDSGHGAMEPGLRPWSPD